MLGALQLIDVLVADAAGLILQEIVTKAQVWAIGEPLLRRN